MMSIKKACKNFVSNLNLFVCKKIRVNKNKFVNLIKIKNSNCSLKTKDVKNENKTNETVEKHAGMSTKKYEQNNCTLTHDNLSEQTFDFFQSLPVLPHRIIIDKLNMNQIYNCVKAGINLDENEYPNTTRLVEWINNAPNNDEKKNRLLVSEKILHAIRTKASYLKLEDAPITSLPDLSKLDFVKSISVYDPGHKAFSDLLSREVTAFPTSLTRILCHSVKKEFTKDTPPVLMDMKKWTKIV
ncbi:MULTISPECIES: hypothetical protein [Candidatus Williamhamiltonella]|nr:hypothetical protein [Candidatus Hamiltonella defensa]